MWQMEGCWFMVVLMLSAPSSSSFSRSLSRNLSIRLFVFLLLAYWHICQAFGGVDELWEVPMIQTSNFECRHVIRRPLSPAEGLGRRLLIRCHDEMGPPPLTLALHWLKRQVNSQRSSPVNVNCRERWSYLRTFNIVFCKKWQWQYLKFKMAHKSLKTLFPPFIFKAGHVSRPSACHIREETLFLMHNGAKYGNIMQMASQTKWTT